VARSRGQGGCVLSVPSSFKAGGECNELLLLESKQGKGQQESLPFHQRVCCSLPSSSWHLPSKGEGSCSFLSLPILLVLHFLFRCCITSPASEDRQGGWPAGVGAREERRGGWHAGGRLLSPAALPLEGGEKDTCKPTEVCPPSPNNRLSPQFPVPTPKPRARARARGTAACARDRRMHTLAWPHLGRARLPRAGVPGRALRSWCWGAEWLHCSVAGVGLTLFCSFSAHA
jgi:hypothetical protein